MELRDYLIILKKNALIIFLFAILGATIASFFATKITSGVSLEQFFYIPEANVDQNQIYGAAGYFAQEKARNFADTAVAILESPDFTKEQVKTPAQITVRKVAPQLLRITVTASGLQSARDALGEIVSGFNQKMISLSGDKAAQIKPIGNSPNLVFSGPTKSVLVVFGLLAGSLFALLVTGLKSYFRL